MQLKGLNYQSVPQEEEGDKRVSRKAIWSIVIVGLVVIALFLLVAVLLLSIFLGIADNQHDDGGEPCIVPTIPSRFYARAQVSGPNIITHDKQWWYDMKQQKEASIIYLNGKSWQIIKENNNPGMHYVFNSHGFCFPAPCQLSNGYVAQSTKRSGTWTHPHTGVVCDMMVATRSDLSEYYYATDPAKGGALCYLEEPGVSSTVFQEFSTDPNVMDAFDYVIPEPCRQGAGTPWSPRSSIERRDVCGFCMSTVNHLVSAGVGALAGAGCALITAGTAAAICGALGASLAEGACEGFGCNTYVCQHADLCSKPDDSDGDYKHGDDN